MLDAPLTAILLPMIVTNDGVFFVVSLSPKEVADLKLELLSVKKTDSLIPFIDKCPLSWQLFSELCANDLNAFYNDTKLNEQEQATNG